MRSVILSSWIAWNMKMDERRGGKREGERNESIYNGANFSTVAKWNNFCETIGFRFFGGIHKAISYWRIQECVPWHTCIFVNNGFSHYILQFPNECKLLKSAGIKHDNINAIRHRSKVTSFYGFGSVYACICSAENCVTNKKNP